VVAVLVALVLAVCTGFMIWAAHYQPLATSGLVMAFGSPPSAKLGEPTTRATLDRLQYGTPWVVYLKKPGDKFGFRYGVINVGNYPVTVIGISGPPNTPLADPPNAIFSARTTRMNKINLDTGQPYFLQSFTPVTIRPHQQDLDMGVTWTYLGCPNGKPILRGHGGAAGPDTFALTYRFLWFTHTVELPLFNKLRLVNTPVC
jgi:hypothetical protein